MITSLAGTPFPPASVVERLKQVDTRLGLKFVDLSWQTTDQRWAITLDWEQRDPRWEMVKRGDVNPADTYDILGYLPADCPPDQAYGYVVSAMRKHRSREDVSFMLAKSHDFNKRVEKEIMDPVLEYAEEQFDRFRHRHFVTKR